MSVRSPARAIAWEFRQGHRVGLLVLLAYLLMAIAVRLLVLGPGYPIRLDPPNALAGLVIVPFSVTFFYFLAVFSFGLSGDLAGRASIYPARMFTLPVKTTALAGWPMLYGGAAMVSLWLMAALLVLRPSGIDMPLIWPALLAAAFLAWTQVLTWMPYGLPGLRVIVTVLWLAALDAIVISAIHYKIPEPRMAAFLAPQLPLAYLAACVALTRARHGDVPDWRGALARLGRISGVPIQRRRHFASPDQAQVWFEWRLHGRSLPALVGVLLPFELGLLFLARNEPPALVFYSLLGVLFTPPFMAGFVAATVGRSSPPGPDSRGVAPFVATRPLTSAALITAKLKAALWSTLLTWLLVIPATGFGLIASSTFPVVIERANKLIEVMGPTRAIAIGLLGLAGLFASTWKQLVQSLCIGLTGREWVIKSSVLASLSFLTVIWPLARWIDRSEAARAALWDALPWIPAVLVGFKMSAAVWIVARLHSRGLVSDRTLLTGAVGWLALVLALWALLEWIFATPHIPRYFFGLIAILAVPLARLAAAPLALAWNRHR